jgi:transposase
LTIAADADDARVVFVTEGRDATTIARFAEHVAAHKARPQQITTVSIDMSPAFIRASPITCPKRASLLINSMSSPTPRPPSTRRYV